MPIEKTKLRNRIVYALLSFTVLGLLLLPVSKRLGAFLITIGIGGLSRIPSIDLPFVPDTFEIGTFLAMILALAYSPLDGAVAGLVNSMLALTWSQIYTPHMNFIRGVLTFLPALLVPFLPFSMPVAIVGLAVISDILFYIFTHILSANPLLDSFTNIVVRFFWYYRLSTILGVWLLVYLV